MDFQALDSKTIYVKLHELAKHHAKHAVYAVDPNARIEHLKAAKLYFEVGEHMGFLIPTGELPEIRDV